MKNTLISNNSTLYLPLACYPIRRRDGWPPLDCLWLSSSDPASANVLPKSTIEKRKAEQWDEVMWRGKQWRLKKRRREQVKIGQNRKYEYSHVHTCMKSPPERHLFKFK